MNGAGTFQQLGNDISEEHKILNQYRSSYREERLELARLRLQKEKLELIVKQFQNDNEDFRRIKELVKQALQQDLTNHRHILIRAFLYIIDSCRRDPLRFNILYHNLPSAKTTEIRMAEVGMTLTNNNSGLLDEHSCYQHNNADDIAYWKFLVDEAEKFFLGRIEELEQVCVNRLIEAFVSAPLSSQLTKKPYLNSEDASSLQTYEIEKKDPLQ